MDNPTVEAVWSLLDKLAVGAMTTLDEHRLLDSDHKSDMPPEFDDVDSESFQDPRLRFKLVGLDVIEPEW